MHAKEKPHKTSLFGQLKLALKVKGEKTQSWMTRKWSRSGKLWGYNQNTLHNAIKEIALKL